MATILFGYLGVILKVNFINIVRADIEKIVTLKKDKKSRDMPTIRLLNFNKISSPVWIIEHFTKDKRQSDLLQT